MRTAIVVIIIILILFAFFGGVINQINKNKMYSHFGKKYDKEKREKQQTQIQSKPVAPKAADDIPAQIKKLADLNKQGIITDEEFDKKKADLLSKM